jgi:Asp-tRNA(Asn)/Glu-tRNA(Gln) amidotransferase B subunit
MERGELRCDVNVSVASEDGQQQSSRCEVKNLNGVKFLQHAIGTVHVLFLLSFPE